MPSLVQRACMLLMALPAAALADPVTVTTRSTGTTYLNDIVLNALGLYDPVPTIAIPYELTLRSTFDWNGSLPPRDTWATQSDSEVVIDFRAGSIHYHYAGTGSSSAVLYTPFSNGGDGYQHEIWLDQGPYNALKFMNQGVGPAGSLGQGGALTPRSFDSASLDGNYGITAYRSNDEYSFAWYMVGEPSTLSVQVLSPVPEPAPFAMLAAGLLALGLRRRSSRTRARQFHPIRQGGTRSSSASAR